MARTPPPPTSDLEVIHLKGVDYYVDWRRVPLGASFFLPTVATPTQVRAALKDVEKHLGIRLTVRARVEYGRYGSRVWRIG